MKITVIGYNPNDGPFSYGSVSVWAANAWKELGHDVEMYDRSEMDKLPEKSDVYFFVDVSEDYSQSMPDDLDGIKIFWNMDMQMPGGTERAVNIARKVDFTFCSNYEYGVKLLEKFGIESFWVTYGYDHILQKEVMTEGMVVDCNHDVCMIGNLNSPERQQLWELLTAKYGDRAFVGTFKNREEYVKGKAGSYIAISQPTEPFNTIINLRVFNALATGRLLLCKRPTIKEHEVLGLKEGVNVVYWDNFDDLIEKVDYYIAHKNEGKKIAKEGFRLGQRYLMPNQIRCIEQVIYNKFYDKLYV